MLNHPGVGGFCGSEPSFARFSSKTASSREPSLPPPSQDSAQSTRSPSPEDPASLPPAAEEAEEGAFPSPWQPSAHPCRPGNCPRPPVSLCLGPSSHPDNRYPFRSTINPVPRPPSPWQPSPDPPPPGRRPGPVRRPPLRKPPPRAPTSGTPRLRGSLLLLPVFSPPRGGGHCSHPGRGAPVWAGLWGSLLGRDSGTALCCRRAQPPAGLGARTLAWDCPTATGSSSKCKPCPSPAENSPLAPLESRIQAPRRPWRSGCVASSLKPPRSLCLSKPLACVL
ncbi:uncharacterized protein [Symphalangus syndactylus]|uniref:uncharacterized protein n=1 Tax=Symphalangus syndactylus TaxID=9590 RepID=UPI00244279B8|nr:uncharacterized protein LOC129459190 [Symphalangus syndactylus]